MLNLKMTNLPMRQILVGIVAVIFVVFVVQQNNVSYQLGELSREVTQLRLGLSIEKTIADQELQQDEQQPKDDEYIIPNIMHYAWYSPDKLKWRFHHLVSVVSSYKRNKPEKIYFWYERLPVGPLWVETLKIVPLTLMYRKGPDSIYDRPIKHPAHKTDIVRLEAILKYGGIYTDLDVIVIKSMDPLRKHEAVMGFETDNSLCNAVIMGKAESPFLRQWHESYRTFDGRQWSHHSGRVPLQIAREHPFSVHLEKRSFFRPNWREIDWLYKEGKVWNWKEHYAQHLWFRFYNIDHDFQSIRSLNTTYGEMCRWTLYNTTELL